MNISLKWFKEQIKNVTNNIIENRMEKAVKELEQEQEMGLKPLEKFIF